MADPLVTVIVTVYKRTNFLAQAVSSALRQTFTSLEVLVTDDANQAVTRDLCASLDQDGRVRYRTNPRTLGTPMNIAAALREARGKYIAILNDDDLLEPQMLGLLVAPLEQMSQVVLAFGNHRIIDQAGQELPEETVQSIRAHGHAGLAAGVIEQPFDFAVRGGAMVVFGCAFRKSVCDPDWLVPEVADAYDYWLAVMLSTRGPFYFSPEHVMSWRRHGNAESVRIASERGAGAVFIYARIEGLPLSGGLRRYVRHRLAHSLYLRGREFLLHGWNGREARAILSLSLKTQWHAKGAAAWIFTFLPARLRCLGFSLWRRVPRGLRSSVGLGHRAA